MFANFTAYRPFNFLIQDIFFDARIAVDYSLLVVQRFDRKAIGYKNPLFNLKFKLYPNRYPHTFKSQIQNVIENLFFNYPYH